MEIHALPVALLPTLLLSAVLTAGNVTSPAGNSLHDGPAVQMTVTPTR